MKKMNKFIFLVSAILISMISSCSSDLANMEFEDDYFEGVDLAKSQNKPIFIYFTNSVLPYDEFREDFIPSRKIRKLLSNKYVTIVLDVHHFWVVDEDKLKAAIAMGLSEEGINFIKSKGSRGSIYQTIQKEKFKSNSHPMYVVLNPNQEILVEPFGYTSKDSKLFLKKLEEGLDEWKK